MPLAPSHYAQGLPGPAECSGSRDSGHFLEMFQTIGICYFQSSVIALSGFLVGVPGDGIMRGFPAGPCLAHSFCPLNP